MLHKIVSEDFFFSEDLLEGFYLVSPRILKSTLPRKIVLHLNYRNFYLPLAKTFMNMYVQTYHSCGKFDSTELKMLKEHAYVHQLLILLLTNLSL